MFNESAENIGQILDRNSIGQSLYDFDRDLFEDGDDEGCD